MKVISIGDVHTKLWIIKAAEKLVDKYDKVVFVGDYADDWFATPQDSIDTWWALKRLQEKYPEKVGIITGNHDYIYVNKTRTLQSGYNSITQLLINSQENKDLKRWLELLPIRIDHDGVTYTHAGVTDTFELPIKNNPDLLWHDNSPLWARPPYAIYKSESTQVFGHTPSETCWEVSKNVWCIDTFSTMSNGTPIGDATILEVTDGKKFSKIKMETKNDNNNTTNSLKGRFS